ncbi:hypothetical protein CFN78_09805 [Amycolatopsis antarctica]|uniref:Uncharacterized protein n=1 Tax=Amycolatopsis antarctica TaxID=1854586 RepID=A0A263D6X9_9PSEU|nr:hypothetical protein [Amycolatopsis antarctica]OZM73165.1 hypothetical protein CFN78_09805 [Amycolatopsis antarctica]
MTETAALPCGYLFDERTKPLFVLTGPDSFSGAEDLAYSLRQRGGPSSSGRPRAAVRDRSGSAS